jgi:hypothetical protein
MAAWLPAVKVILPYLSQIVTAVLPAFTKKSTKDDTGDVIPNQISELQTAVTHNAESLKILATQLQQVISGIDSGSAKAEKEIQIVKWLSISAIITSFIAIVLWLTSWLH